MSQVSRGAMKLSSLIDAARLNRRLPSTFFVSPKLYSTGAAKPGLGAADDQFLRSPRTGLVFGKLTDITKHTTKSDVISLLDGCDLTPGKLKVEYSHSYYPMSMVVEFPSISSYDTAIRTISRKGCLYVLIKADKSEWDTLDPYDGKAIVLRGIPFNALRDDVERFLSGCQYDSSSISIFVRQTNKGPTRMATVRFPSRALAMHAYITKNRGFCLNNQITVQVLH